MKTIIWLNGGYKNIKPESPVNTFRAVTSFCVENCLANNLVKLQGGYYSLSSKGTFVYQFRTLQGVTFNELYSILNKPL